MIAPGSWLMMSDEGDERPRNKRRNGASQRDPEDGCANRETGGGGIAHPALFHFFLRGICIHALLPALVVEALCLSAVTVTDDAIGGQSYVRGGCCPYPATAGPVTTALPCIFPLGASIPLDLLLMQVSQLRSVTGQEHIYTRLRMLSRGSYDAPRSCITFHLGRSQCIFESSLETGAACILSTA